MRPPFGYMSICVSLMSPELMEQVDSGCIACQNSTALKNGSWNWPQNKFALRLLAFTPYSIGPRAVAVFHSPPCILLAVLRVTVRERSKQAVGSERLHIKKNGAALISFVRDLSPADNHDYSVQAKSKVGLRHMPYRDTSPHYNRELL